MSNTLADQSRKFFQVQCINELDIFKIEAITTPKVQANKTPNYLDKLKKIGIHEKSTEPFKQSCQVGDKIYDLEIVYEQAHLKRCGGNPSAEISLKADDQVILDKQLFHETCGYEGWGTTSFSSILINRFEALLCVSVDTANYSSCKSISLDDPIKPINLRDYIQNNQLKMIQ